ncbi:MAG: acyltransferase [Bacilli bacterium]|jgi:fucose 4-O-acetylase-like acetyltransferase
MGKVFKLNYANRDLGLDLVKCLCMLLVVLDHSLQKYVPGIFYTPLYNIIWLLQMPAFFFISGYLSKKTFSDIKTFLLWAAKTAIFYLVPFLTHGLLIYATQLLRPAFGTFLYGLIANPDSSLWFLFVLFWIVLIVGLGTYLSHFLKNRVMKFLLPLFFAVFLELIAFIIFERMGGLFFSSKLIIYYNLIYCAGYIGYFVKNNFCVNIQNKKVFFWITTLVAGVGFFTVVFAVPSAIFLTNSIGDLLIRIAGSFCGVIFVVQLFSKASSQFKFLTFLGYCGQYSLEIYYLHRFFVRFAPDLGTLSVINQWLAALFLFVVLIVMSIIALIVLFLVPFGHLIMFGKAKSLWNFEHDFLALNAFMKQLR